MHPIPDSDLQTLLRCSLSSLAVTVLEYGTTTVVLASMVAVWPPVVKPSQGITMLFSLFPFFLSLFSFDPPFYYCVTMLPMGQIRG